MAPKRSTRQNPGQPETVTMTSAAIEAMIAQRVTDAIANYEANRNAGSGQGSSQGTHGENLRTCTYKDFQNCRPKSFFGNEGATGLTRWIEKMESVFQLSFCSEDCKVRYAASTFSDSALSWWNSHVKTVGIETANAMSWEELKEMLLEEYCPRDEIQNLEQELWNLTMKDANITAYTNRFNELATLCPGMVTPEYKKIERYIWGLAPQIQGMVTASKPSTFNSAKQIAVRLTNQGIRQGTLVKNAETQVDKNNKRKPWNNSQRNSQQTPDKKQRTITAYAATAEERPFPQRQYAGELPRCDKCGYHHKGSCRECYKCNRKGHTARFCRTQVPEPNPGTSAGVSQSCFECGEVGHIKRNCPKVRGQGGNNQARAFTIGTSDAKQEPSVVTGTFLVNNLYATILFDSGADKSFITPNFKQLLKHKSSRLKEAYKVEMANG